jgi:GR25 family glycosyltransferase involved in LPS biosynthesis
MIEHIHQTIEGWCSIEQQQLYTQIVDSLPSDSPTHIVEIGCWKGKSTSYMAVEIANSGKPIRFDAIDHFKGSPEHHNNLAPLNPSILALQSFTTFNEYQNNIKPVAQYVNTVVQSSSIAVLKYENESLDFVFIDGSHDYDSVREDILNWLPKIKPGGMIAGDDYSNEWSGVMKAVDEQFQEIVMLDKTIWSYVKKPNVASIEPTFNIKYQTDQYLSINSNHDLTIESAYILSIEGNATSKTQTEHCVASCENVGMPYKIFYGYDGTDKRTIKTPKHLMDKDYMKWIRVLDTGLSITETCCALGHLALWYHCITIDRPIVILEHDAVMLRPLTQMSGYNRIEYLGHKYELSTLYKMFDCKTETTEELSEKMRQNMLPLTLMPHNRRAVTSVINYNYLYPMGLHAYAIDPIMARRLIAHVMTEGLVNPIDTVPRIDKFATFQTGVYAVQRDDSEKKSTIAYFDENGLAFQSRKNTYTLPGVTR